MKPAPAEDVSIMRVLIYSARHTLDVVEPFSESVTEVDDDAVVHPLAIRL